VANIGNGLQFRTPVPLGAAKLRRPSYRSIGEMSAPPQTMRSSPGARKGGSLAVSGISLSQSADEGDQDSGCQVLWEDGERVFCRGWRLGQDGSRSAVLVVLPAAAHPSPCDRRAETGGDGPRVDGGGRGRLRRRPDREDPGLPGRRDQRRTGQSQAVSRDLRLRRGDRLQGARARKGDRKGLPQRRECLFRQHVRRHQRYGLFAAFGWSARGDLRHRLDLLLGSVADRAAHRTAPPGQARTARRAS
jgi:hypothetical protein